MKCPKCDPRPVDYASHYTEDQFTFYIDSIISKKIQEINVLQQEIDVLLSCLRKMGLHETD